MINNTKNKEGKSKKEEEDDELLNKIARKVEKKLIDHMQNKSQQNLTISSDEEIKVDLALRPSSSENALNGKVDELDVNYRKVDNTIKKLEINS